MNASGGLKMTLRQWLGLLIFVVVCFAVSGLGSIAMIGEIPAWYAALRKPSWTPPTWMFGPVWAFLYLTMAVSAWLVWRRLGLAGAAKPLTLFALQLALNLAWSWVFFHFHLIGPAFLDIILLWLAILATMISFWRVTPLAGWLLTPYILWVSYAATLNYGIWRMNAG